MKNVKLPFRISGEGKPLVLVPGGLTGWKSWEPFVDTFTSWKRKVILVQLLNVDYGLQNIPLTDDYSVSAESHALASTLESEAGNDAVDLIAWSYGALVSLDFAINNPGRIRSMTLIEPPAIWILRESGKLDDETGKSIQFLESLSGEISDEMLSGFLREVGLVKPGQSPGELPQWQQWLPYKQSLRNSTAVVEHNDSLSRLRNITFPVLLVKGTGSAKFLHNIIDVLGSELPDSRVIELDGGHAPHIVSRDKFMQETEKMIRVPARLHY